MPIGHSIIMTLKQTKRHVVQLLYQLAAESMMRKNNKTDPITSKIRLGFPAVGQTA